MEMDMNTNRARRWVITSVIYGLIVTGLGIPLSEAQDRSEPATRHSRSIPEPMRYQGLLLPEQQVQLGTPREGILKTLNVEEGDRVEKGQTLLVIDDREQAARVRIAKLRSELEAELKRAELAVEEARISLDMITRAFEQDAASDWEVRRSRLQLEQQQASVEALKEQQKVSTATLAYEEAGLEQFTLHAPFTGEIVEVMTEEGSTLRREDKVLTLVSMSPLRAELRLPIQWFGKLKAGQKYKLQVGQPINQIFESELKFIDPRIDPASQTFRCVFAIPNEDHAIPSGIVARLAEQLP